MGAWAPISDSKDIFIDDDAGLAADKAAPLNALHEKKSKRRVRGKEGRSSLDITKKPPKKKSTEKLVRPHEKPPRNKKCGKAR